MISFTSIFIDKKPNSLNEHINYNKISLKTYISYKWYLKRKLQNSFIQNTCLFGSSYKDVLPNYVVKCLENIIESEQDSWNNCTFAHISLNLHKLTGWFIVLCMNVVQLLKHFWNYCLSSFYTFYQFPWERVGCWF